jgi:hypothetical protein
MTIQDNILTADEGKWLTNGQTYSQQVWLGINDSPSNWHEVDESEAEELTDSEALQIITEGE